MARAQRVTGSSVLGVVLAGSLLVLGATGPVLVPVAPAGAAEELGREAPMTPQQLGFGAVDGLQYADPASGLSLIDPPAADTGGAALLTYPLMVPEGRGIGPELALSYDSGGGNGWVGVGWDLAIDEVAVDTTFGAPWFDPDRESESYTLDGEALVPNALGATWQDRVAERSDWTRQHQTEFERIIRHGDSPRNYFWEVWDKAGGVRWYGGTPDTGGPVGDGSSVLDPSGVVTNDEGDIVRWLLTARRDVGVNLVTYDYRTLTYRSTDSGWVRDESCAPSDTRVCARHTYPSSISYTRDSSDPADLGAYRVDFLLGSDLTPRAAVRTDPVVDGSGTYLDVLTERLARVEVHYGTPPTAAPGSDEDLYVRYELGYATQTAFGKTQLTTVTQTGGDADEAVTHTFGYYDDVRDASGGYDGFADPTTWRTTKDLKTRTMLETEVAPGILGASTSNSAEGHAYVGFNALIPDKIGSFGGSLQIGGGQTDALAEWIDLDGDGLPDKVWLDGSTVNYRLQRADDGEGRFGPVAEKVRGLSRLSSDSNVGFQVAAEAYLGVTVSFGVGLDVSWSNSYFTDINADGLPDFVAGTTPYFNHLDATTGSPTFTADSSQTWVPLAATEGPDVPPSERLEEAQAELRRASPPVDTVRRWVAPFDGTVSIDAPVTFEPPTSSPDGVRVRVQVGDDDVLGDEVLTSAGQQAFLGAMTADVVAGEPVWFRLGSGPEGTSDEVAWSPVITYTRVAGYDDPADVPTDDNGLSQVRYSAADDFTVAGRPGTRVMMPYTGHVVVEAVVDKSGPLSDDVRLEVLHNGAPVDAWDPVEGRVDTWPTIGADVTGSIGGTMTVAVAEPTPPDPDHPDRVPPEPDTLQLQLRSDSPVDLSKVEWHAEIRYTDATLDGQVVPVEADGKPTITFEPTPEVDVFSDRRPAGPLTTWTSTVGGDLDARVTGTRTKDAPAGRLNVVVKDADGVVARGHTDLGTGSGAFTSTVELDGDLAEDADYWVQVTMSDPGVGSSTTVSGMELLDASGEVVASPDHAVLFSGRQDIFPLAYRGWGVAGYTAGGDKEDPPIDASAFEIDVDELRAGEQNPTSADDVDRDPPESVAFLGVPAGTGVPTGDEETTVLPGAQWQGPRTSMAVSADRARSSLLGADNVELTTSGQTGRVGQAHPLTRVGITAPSAALAVGVGPFGGSFGLSPSFGVQDYVDLNGDGYPDQVTPGSVSYTSQRGSLHASKDGPAVVNQNLTMSVQGGLSSGLVDIKGNAKGVTNATGGDAASKGGDADENGGANFGAEVGYSWTSPNASGGGAGSLLEGGSADPTGDFADEIADAGGTDPDSAAIQQELADMNGDGLPDRVFTTPSGVFVAYNLGYGFTQSAVRLATGGFEAKESASGAVSAGFTTPWGEFSGGLAMNWNYDLARTTWTDVNGDGILDRVYKADVASSPTVSFGTGSGLLPAVTYGQMLSGARVMGQETGPHASFDRANSLGGGFDFQVAVGPLCLVACYLIINPGASYQNTLSSTEVALTDVDGDGYADSVSSDEDSELTVSRNRHGRTGLLATVDNPLGGRMTLDYERTGNTVDHPDSLWVLDTVRLADTRVSPDPVLRSDLDYDGLRYDRVHRQSLGFATVVEHEVDPGTGLPVRTTTSTYLNDNVFVAGLQTSVLVTDAALAADVADGTAAPGDENIKGARMVWGLRDARAPMGPLNTATSTVDPDTLPGPNEVGTLGDSWAPLLLQVTQQVYNGAPVGEETGQQFTYDGLGNIIEQVDLGETETSSDDVTTITRFSTCASSWAGDQPCWDDDEDTPAPAGDGPLWDATVCPSWVSIPAEISVYAGEVTASSIPVRHRDGSPALCDNSAVTHLVEDVDGARTAVTDLAFDHFGNYDRIVYPAGDDGVRYAVSYTYDPQEHRQIAEVTDHDFDTSAGTDAVDAFLGDDADASGALRTGVTASATFDLASGQVVTRTDAAGATTAYTYDSLGRLSSQSLTGAPDEVLLAYRYRPGGGVATVQHTDAAHPGDTIDTASFVDGLGRPALTKRDATLDRGPDPASPGRVVTGEVGYDVLGRVVEEYYPREDPSADLTAWPAAGTQNRREIVLDLWDGPNVVTEPGGRVTTIVYTYDTIEVDGTPTEVYMTTTTDPRGRASTSWTDVRDRQLQLQDAPDADVDPLTSRYSYDALGQLRSFTDSAGVVTTHGYDLLGNHTWTRAPDAGLVELGYDPVGRLTSRTSPVLRDAGTPITYRYQLDRLVAVDNPGTTPDVTYTYGGPDADGRGAGRLVRTEDGSRIQTLEYDAAGRVTSQLAELKAHNWTPETGENFRWRTQWSYDGLGRMMTMTYPDSEVLTYGYDSGGMPDRLSGSEEGYIDVVVGYDADGKPLYERRPHTWTYPYVDGRTYDEFLAPRVTRYGNAVTTTRTYDPDTRWLDRQVTLSANRVDPSPDYQEIQDLNYEYDAVGNVLRYTNELPAPTPSLFGGPVEQTYTLDPFDRLVSAHGTWRATKDDERVYDTTLVYDEHRNVVGKEQKDVLWSSNGKKARAKVLTDTSVSFDRTYADAAPGMIATAGQTTYHWDGNGNLLGTKDPKDRWIRQIGWDAQDRVVSVDDSSASTTYGYDDDGGLAMERGPNGETSFVNPWVTVRNNTELYKHLWLGEERIGTQRDDGGEEELARYFFHADLLGSTNVATDHRGRTFQRQEYFPSGQVWIAENSTVYRTPYQYAGYYTDERRDLLRVGERWYDPTAEILYSPDRILVEDPTAVVDRPELRGAYGYAGANPATNVDPTGQLFIASQARKAQITAADKAARASFRADRNAYDAALMSLPATRRAMLQKAMGKEGGFDARALNDKLEPNALIEVDLTTGKVTIGAWYGKRATLWKFGKGAATTDEAKGANDAPVTGPTTDQSATAPDGASASTAQGSTTSASSSPGTGGPAAPDAATDARATTSGEGSSAPVAPSTSLSPAPQRAGPGGSATSPRTGEGGAG